MTKKILLALFLLTLSTQAVAAQTSITPRSNTQFSAAASPTPAPAVVTPVPTPTPAVVATTTKGGVVTSAVNTASTTATTKGGMPVTGTVHQAVLLAFFGLSLMSWAAYKVARV